MIQLFLRSARQLHAVVLSRLLRGPLVWFQRRPHGRILNKFSSDIMKADLLLPEQAQSLLENVCFECGAVVVGHSCLSYSCRSCHRVVVVVVVVVVSDVLFFISLSLFYHRSVDCLPLSL